MREATTQPLNDGEVLPHIRPDALPDPRQNEPPKESRAAVQRSPAAANLNRDNEKRSAALSSALSASALTLLKLITGILTGSIGMLSEAAHSSIDLLAAVITLFSVQAADQPADDDHNYGHGKIESLSAFFETLLMLASAVWIITEAVRRIVFHRHLELTLTAWPFAVLLLSMAVDFVRSRNLRRVAEQHRSEALEADALHYSTDIWSSAAVIAGLAAAFAGEIYHLPALEYADPAAALVVSVIILRVTWKLARRTMDTLLDATPLDEKATARETRESLLRELAGIEGVLSVNRLRTRRSGPGFFADVTLGIPRNVTFQRSEQITASATDAVRRHLPDADVVIHSIPTASEAESIHDRVRAVAARANLVIHDVSVKQYAGNLRIEQHLEVDESLSLRAAHDLVTRLEAEIRAEVPTITGILTHIESEPATIEHPASLELDRQLEVRLRRVAKRLPEILDVHDVLVSKINDRIQVNCHCTLPDDLSMTRVHAIITALENAFKLDSPEVARLLIHPEPATDNRR